MSAASASQPQAKVATPWDDPKSVDGDVRSLEIGLSTISLAHLHGGGSRPPSLSLSSLSTTGDDPVQTKRNSDGLGSMLGDTPVSPGSPIRRGTHSRNPSAQMNIRGEGSQPLPGGRIPSFPSPIGHSVSSGENSTITTSSSPVVIHCSPPLDEQSYHLYTQAPSLPFQARSLPPPPPKLDSSTNIGRSQLQVRNHDSSDVFGRSPESDHVRMSSSGVQSFGGDSTHYFGSDDRSDFELYSGDHTDGDDGLAGLQALRRDRSPFLSEFSQESEARAGSASSSPPSFPVSAGPGAHIQHRRAWSTGNRIESPSGDDVDGSGEALITSKTPSSWDGKMSDSRLTGRPPLVKKSTIDLPLGQASGSRTLLNAEQLTMYRGSQSLDSVRRAPQSIPGKMFPEDEGSGHPNAGGAFYRNIPRPQLRHASSDSSDVRVGQDLRSQPSSVQYSSDVDQLGRRTTTAMDQMATVNESFPFPSPSAFRGRAVTISSPGSTQEQHLTHNSINRSGQLESGRSVNSEYHDERGGNVSFDAHGVRLGGSIGASSDGRGQQAMQYPSNLTRPVFYDGSGRGGPHIRSFSHDAAESDRNTSAGIIDSHSLRNFSRSVDGVEYDPRLSSRRFRDGAPNGPGHVPSGQMHSSFSFEQPMARADSHAAFAPRPSQSSVDDFLRGEAIRRSVSSVSDHSHERLDHGASRHHAFVQSMSPSLHRSPRVVIDRHVHSDSDIRLQVPQSPADISRRSPMVGTSQEGSYASNLPSPPLFASPGSLHENSPESSRNQREFGLFGSELSHPLVGERIEHDRSVLGPNMDSSRNQTSRMFRETSMGGRGTEGAIPAQGHHSSHSPPLDHIHLPPVGQFDLDPVPRQLLPPGLALPPGGGGPRVVYNVKFKRTQRSFILGPRMTRDVRIGSYVKVEADRGEDLGIVVSTIPAERFNASGRGATFRYPLTSPDGTSESVLSVVGAGGVGQGGAAALKRIIRQATHDEVSLLELKREKEEELLRICRAKVQQRALPMNVVDAEYQFDRHKLTFFFEAEGRIDFRELVRDLFSIYKTRIWMQQLDKNTNGMVPSGATSQIVPSATYVESDQLVGPPIFVDRP